MRFRIAGNAKIYSIDAIDKLRLSDLLILQTDSKRLGREITIEDINVMQTELEALPKAEQKGHPNSMWIAAVGIFAARRLAGDDLTFEDAISFPVLDLEWLPDPQDRKAPEDPTRARQGSGRAAKSAAASSSKRKTSSSR